MAVSDQTLTGAALRQDTGGEPTRDPPPAEAPRLGSGGGFGRWAAAARWIRPRPSTVAALVLTFAAVALRLLNPWPVELLQFRVFDLYQQIMPRPQDPLASPVVIVDIDEESLTQYGQWPWARTVIANLIAGVANAGAAVIGFDIVFAEADRLSPNEVANTLAQVPEDIRDSLRGMQSNDAILADVIGQTGRTVLGRANFTRIVADRAQAPAEERVVILRPKGLSEADALKNFDTFASLVVNVPELEQNAAGYGLFSLSDEQDSTVRRVPMLSCVADSAEQAAGQGCPERARVYPALTLEMLRVVLGQSRYIVRVNEAGIESIGLQGGPANAGFELPTDERGKIYVHFSEHEPKRYVSAAKILTGDVDPTRLAGKLALIGISAVGLLDIRSTPVSPLLPGVEVHANILENVIADALLSRPNYANSVEALMILVGCLLLILFVPRLGALRTLLLGGASIAAVVALCWWLFIEHRVLIDYGMTALSTTAVFAVLVFANYMRDEAEKRRIRDAFSHYMAPAMVRKLAEDPGQLKLGGEMREMTLLFSDIRGFTTISEQFRADPEGLTRFINRFLTPMTDIILEQEGTIDKYMGDAIMAFWNAPLGDPEHARHACRAALTMISRVGSWNEEMRADAEAAGRLHHPIAIGVGLNTGQCCVGNMGSSQRFDYSVLGDTVNLASRLEGQSKAYGVDIVIGEETRAQVPEMAALQLDYLRVKGKLEPV
ncbi:MAG: adenylate/guanylate cyclase domain-containing protein, partial [Alphaproteobacteria bacterium]|nr:adenylate/guanylate cyclase domain-containing protein [Alphaproteobacteria bacterium]